MGIFVFDVVRAYVDGLTSVINTVTNNVTDLSTSTDTSVQNLQNFTISTQTSGYRNPAWVARYPIADVTYPDALNLYGYLQGTTAGASAGTAHTHNIQNGTSFSGPQIINIAQNESLGGYVTISNPTVMDTIGFYAYVGSGTVNNIFVDVFKENPSTTALTRISSTNIASLLGGGATYVETSPTSSFIAQSGERYLVKIRNASSVVGTVGVITVATGAQLSPDVAFLTSGSTLSNQSSYTAAEATTARGLANRLPWYMLAAKTIAATDQSFSDDFNRSTFGGLWLLSSSWATQLGITSSMATYQGSTNGDQNALYIRSCIGDDNRVDFDVSSTASATTHARCGGFLHANQDLSQMVYLGVTDNAVNIYSGSTGSLTSRATISTTGNDGSWSLIYNTGTNTYTAYKGGVTVGLSWTDSGNVVTQGDGYRFGGVRVSRVSSVNAGTVDNWTLRDYA